VQETFREASGASEDVFSQHFETDIQKLETETPPHTLETAKEDNLISVTPPSPPSSSSSSSDRDFLAKSSKEETHLTNGSVHSGLPPETGKTWSESSSASHRVTFNEAREVACEDGDGTFTVTYSGLGERVREPDRRTSTKTPGLRVMMGQTSELETVELPFKLTESHNGSNCGRNVTFDEDSLLSYKSSKAVEEERDNPFQPEGEVSQDADLIIQLWKGGKIKESEDLQENMKTLALDSLDSSTKDDSVQSDSGNELSADESDNKMVTSNKVSSPAKIPVINSGDMNYIVMMNNGTQKHKNKIKKHCNLM